MQDSEIAKKYDMTVRTVRNWSDKGVQCGVVPPWGSPRDLIEWYRSEYGREPTSKMRKAIESCINADDDKSGADFVLAVDGEAGASVVEEFGSVDLIERACVSLGLASTLARIVEEEENAWQEYRTAKERKMNVATAKKDWKEATELKRSVHKTTDAVEVALKLMKDWARGEWEPGWKDLKIRLSGGNMGLLMRDAMLSEVSEAEYVAEWDKMLERVVLQWSDGDEG